MKKIVCLAGLLMLCQQAVCLAEVKVTTERGRGSLFQFRQVPVPAINDAASTAKIAIVAGEDDGNGAGVKALVDGVIPSGDDDPGANFFFAGGEARRFVIDLGKATNIKNVASYSWHPDERAPQVYTLYGAGEGHTTAMSSLEAGQSPAENGWTKVADVDTRRNRGPRGGQHAALIEDPKANLGTYRYLLFDVSKADANSPFGETFFSEIDVIDADAKDVERIKTPDPVLITFDADGGKYEFTIDATMAPDLKDWSEEKLKPVVIEWYPKIVKMLDSDGFDPIKKVTLRFQNDMGGTPAWAAGPNIALNIEWYRGQLKGEALGAAVHELVHVAQMYPNVRRDDAKPGWVQEGVADYVRWFLYEPQTRGAEITARSLPNARYDASYRVTGNFLDWASRTYDKDLVKKLNASVRQGKYSSDFWKETTGLTEQELNDAWIAYHTKRLQKN